ncbi:nitrous oxide reductase accessory protein NosL [Neobacillus sp. FSL H8-0543]|uniref:nitrous oxide reductase accessory protein NosL n=1 Tax=Neobacillus sp. FSL H8-0543 TaxID=2954672 RepID=UPI00315918E5
MKTQIVKLFTMSLILLIIISGCGKKEEYTPVAINEDTDKCEVCNMAIKDDQFATQIILENGKAIVFDDLGCMYKWMKENEEKKIAKSYVKDYQSKEWLEADMAFFVYDKPTKTPMAYNVIAFSTEEDAQKFITENDGKLLTSDELDNHSWERNEEMMKEMKEMMKSGMDHSKDSH